MIDGGKTHLTGVVDMDDLYAKSVLIVGGDVKVPVGFEHPYADAAEDGTGMFMLSFGKTRIYKHYSPEAGEFELCGRDGFYSLTHRGELFLDRVELVKRYSHAPNQANINLGRYDSDDEMLVALKALVDTDTVRGISVSTGSGTTIDDCVRMIGRMHESYPSIPIGLSYRVCSRGDLQAIKDAGVREYKLNVGSTVPRLFDAINPGQNLEDYLDCFRNAVSVFGKGSVANSLYAGLGETDSEMEKSIRDLASIGVLSDIKMKKITDRNKAELESCLGPIPLLSADKLASFGLMLKTIEAEYGLDPNTYKTLCNACRGCNLVPFMDF